MPQGQKKKKIVEVREKWESRGLTTKNVGKSTDTRQTPPTRVKVWPSIPQKTLEALIEAGHGGSG